MNSHDPARFAELVSENYVNHNPRVEPGLAGLVKFMGHWFDTLSDTRVVVEDAFAVATASQAVTPIGLATPDRSLACPASGADITMRSIDIWRFENDRFVEHWDELNLLEVFQQMGAIPIATR